jgi:hypothetical protein
VYDEHAADMFDPAVVTPVVDLLAGLAGRGGALELGIGTGRIALPLAERGVRVAGEFSLVYLISNTIFNLVTQDAQVACFENAAAHLGSGGRFVIETGVPDLQNLPVGQTIIPFRADPGGMGFDVYDVVTQRFSSQHYDFVDGRVEAHPVGQLAPGAVHQPQPRPRVGAPGALNATAGVRTCSGRTPMPTRRAGTACRTG